MEMNKRLGFKTLMNLMAPFDGVVFVLFVSLKAIKNLLQAL